MTTGSPSETAACAVVRVAVEQTSLSYDKLYTYRWPSDCGEPVAGVRVLVPFGGGNRRRQGLVMETGTAANAAGLKPILTVEDPAPLLNAEMLELVRFLRDRTFCTYFDAVRTMVPTGLYLQLHTVLRPAADVPPAVLETLSPREKAALAFVSAHPHGAEEATVQKELGLEPGSPVIRNLLERQVLVRSEDAVRQVGDATRRMVRRLAWQDDRPAPTLTDKQKSVLRLLEDVGAASVKEVCYFTGVTAAVVQALARKELVELYDAEVLRRPYADETVDRPPLPSQALNDEQQTAYDTLCGLYQSEKPAAALLYGVTGSGKTAVYMSLIDRVLADGRQVIVLVPEISLTPQTMELFLRKYGSRVAVLHSGLAIGERMDEWKRIRRGDARVVVGTRSAVFAPCEDLGMIVMDEEQEHTYKSESSPRYHARDVAKFRCARHNALLLLASATPSVETYDAAKSGRYVLTTLTKRYGETCLPEVEIVDMRQDPGAAATLGSRLRQAMRECLDDGQQVILLLNRRGYHTHVSCRSCGEVLQCPSCSISLTYHRANDRLMCHYCGYSRTPPAKCPRCDSDKLFYAGLGTQLVEQELEASFPDVPVLRVDTDTTQSRLSYEQKFKAFAAGEYRIMIGTQMVAKGLDFPQVGLVGVLSADQSLYGDDYRSYETTFSLLTQVIGRAGRRQTRGRAIVQTYTPDNPVIGLAARQDYTGFFGLEIAARRMWRYPPYADLFLLGLSGTDETQVRGGVKFVFEKMRAIVQEEFSDLPLIALDPTPAAVLRVAGKYRYKLLLKAKNTARMREMIRRLTEAFYAEAAFRTVTLTVDVNPASML